MSQAPRPHRKPSATAAENGSNRQRATSPGEDEVRRPRSDAGVEIEDGRRSRRLEGHELGLEPSANEKVAQIGQRAAVDRRHRGKGDQRARDVEGGGRRGHEELAMTNGE
jgi:hypothetical protein